MSDLPKARGKRPAFADDPAIDSLAAMVLALAGEVVVLRERLDTLERLADTRGLIPRAEIETYRASPAIDAERETWRAKFLERVLLSVEARLEEAKAGETAERYDAVVNEISEPEPTRC